MKIINAETYLSHPAYRRRVIDVRSPAEYRALHLPGSENIPLDEIQAGHVPVLQAGELATLVCLSGKRSGMACEVLAQKLGGNIATIDGGITALQNAGVAMNSSKSVWSLERQVRGVAGTLVVIGVLLSYWFPGAILLSGFVGAGLLFSAITDSCAMAIVLGKMPWNQ